MLIERSFIQDSDSETIDNYDGLFFTDGVTVIFTEEEMVVFSSNHGSPIQTYDLKKMNTVEEVRDMITDYYDCTFIKPVERMKVTLEECEE